MAIANGATGLVTSWAGTGNSQLISTGNSPMRFRLSTNADEFDSTAFAASLVARTYLKGMRQWGGTIEGRRPTAITGAGSSVSFSAGYVINMQEFDITLRASETDVTPMGDADTQALWSTHIPGIIEIEASWTSKVDDTTAVTAPANSSEPATATFTISSGVTIACSGFTTSQEIDAEPGRPPIVAYTMRGSGNITTVGATNILTAAAAVPIPVAGSLVLQAATGRTYTGDAFWTEVNLRSASREQVLQSVTFRGTGDLAYA